MFLESVNNAAVNATGTQQISTINNCSKTRIS